MAGDIDPVPASVMSSETSPFLTRRFLRRKMNRTSIRINEIMRRRPSPSERPRMRDRGEEGLVEDGVCADWAFDAVVGLEVPGVWEEILAAVKADGDSVALGDDTDVGMVLLLS